MQLDLSENRDIAGLCIPQEAHTNCVIFCIFDGNIENGHIIVMYCDEYFLYEIKISVFSPEMLCVVILVAENGEFWRFAGFCVGHLPDRINYREIRVESSLSDRASAEPIFTYKFLSLGFQITYKASWKLSVSSHTIIFESRPKLEALDLK